MDKVCFERTWSRKGKKGQVVCNLCPFHCKIDLGQNGVCRVRGNRDGQLVLSNYGEVIHPVFDRIQKRPVYLYPGYPADDKKVNSLSLGSTGCNNRCPFCQNFEISQTATWADLKQYDPEYLVNKAVEEGVDFISFSFNEMIVIYEFFCDIADLAHEKGLKICAKTAGYISLPHQDDFLDRIDVMNLDIKPMNYDYIKQCGIMDHTVVEYLLKRALERGIHTEISHILIEGVNNIKDCMERFARLMLTLKPDIPIHLLRHYPAWKSHYKVTSDESLEKWGDFLKKKGLTNVFTDDVG